MKKIIIIALLVCVTAVFTFSNGFAEALKGRDFVRLGTIATLEGKLIEEGHEWSLRHANGVYELHLGPSDFRADKGFTLQDGEIATVKGFVHEKDVAVTSIETGGETLTLRDNTGRPAWAGSRFSNGKGAGNWNHSDHDM